MFTGFAQVLLRFCSTIVLSQRKDDIGSVSSRPWANRGFGGDDRGVGLRTTEGVACMESIHSHIPKSHFLRYNIIMKRWL